MVRPYAVKGKKKLKKRPRIEEEEEEEDEKVSAVNEEEEAIEAVNGNKKSKGEQLDEDEEDDEEKAEEAIEEMPGIPVGPAVSAHKKEEPGVIFVLERASLEVAKVGKTFQLLNSDDHDHFLRKQGRNPRDYRPDIIHQALLAILDSPLNKAGRLRALYVRTEKGVLFEVKPHVNLPRTFKRFYGLMSQLLQNLSITAAGKREKLLNVIKNPVTRHLPVNSRRIGLSFSSEKKVQLRDYVAAASDDVTLVFVVGAMSHGKINNDYTDDFISTHTKCNKLFRPSDLYLARRMSMEISSALSVVLERRRLLTHGRMHNMTKRNPGYSALRQRSKVLGTWDDHDYGLNDAGKEFSRKSTTQKLLLGFLDKAEDSPRRKQAGGYASYLFATTERQVKVILLDTRYHYTVMEVY